MSSNAMLEAKAKLRQAESDRQLLVNRIALLKKEEERAWRKIAKTKQKAEAILKIRYELQRTCEQRATKHVAEASRQRREAELHLAADEAARRQREKKLADIVRAKKSQVVQVREAAARARDEIRERKLQDVIGKQQKRAVIKSREEDLRRKRDRERLVLVEENRKRYDAKVALHAQQTHDKELQVMKMERMEMHLIQRLKKTQIIQHQAFEDLEHALNGDLALVFDATAFTP